MANRPLLLVVAVVLSSLGIPSPAGAQSSPPRFRLYVSLFSSIPDAAADDFRLLKIRIKKEFELGNPGIELLIRDLDTRNDDAYTVKSDKPTRIGTWLTAPVAGDDPNASGVHVVEADMVVLGELVRQDLIKSWEMRPDPADWHPAAAEAVTLNGKTYGIPHWLCGTFIFSATPPIPRARNSGELRAALDRSQAPIHLAGRIKGSWNFASLYLDAYADTYGAQSVEQALKDELDEQARLSLQTVARACTKNGANPCLGDLGDPYTNATAAPYLLADGEADAVLGYSERLHFILRRAGRDKKIYFESAPLGDGNRPLLFVDAFVLRKDCAGPCEAAARAFAQYMTRPETMSWIMMSEDAGATGVPRYLLAATKSAYRTPAVRNDRYYLQMEQNTREGLPYPNTKFYDVREALLGKLKEQVKP
jgi:thiamine pyridinylase